MSKHDPSSSGIHLTKQYYREDFGPSDFQWDVTKIDKDFTLLDLFKLVHLAETVTPGIAKVFGMSNFDLFWDQINKPREQDTKDDIEYLELYWSLKCNSKEVYKLPNLMSFHGVSLGKNNATNQGCGIEFTPVNNLAHLPICVLLNVNFSPPFIQFKINPTLWCFITSIFRELTWSGSTPDEIVDKVKQILDISRRSS